MKGPKFILQIVLSTISSFSLLLVGMFLLLHPNFKKHPYRLIAYTCLFEASVFCGQFNNVFIDYFQQYVYFARSSEIFKLLVTGQFSKMLHFLSLSSEMKDEWVTYSTIYEWHQAFMVLFKSITYFSIIVNICLNSFLMLDLYLTLKNPFYPRTRRARKYFAISFVVSVTYIVIISYFVTKQGTN